MGKNAFIGMTFKQKVNAIYQKGRQAAYDNHYAPMQPPYKLTEYRRAWQAGFDDLVNEVEAIAKQTGKELRRG